MRNRGLALDYVRRAEIRLRAVDVLFEAESWADVVREAQEVVELALKGLLRAHGIEAPRIHDVSEVLRESRDSLPLSIRGGVDRLAEVSRRLRRDRELAFCGTEDLTPSDFYSGEDAATAREDARATVATVKPVVV